MTPRAAVVGARVRACAVADIPESIWLSLSPVAAQVTGAGGKQATPRRRTPFTQRDRKWKPRARQQTKARRVHQKKNQGRYRCHRPRTAAGFTRVIDYRSPSASVETRIGAAGNEATPRLDSREQRVLRISALD